MVCKHYAAPLFALVISVTLRAADADGFTLLFNGKDLSGWVNMNVAPGTFTVRDGIIVSTGKPTGVMRTEKEYENFILELEWSHRKPGGNAGVFIWSDPLPAQGVPFAKAIEVQVLDGNESKSYTSHGDVFSIHGASMVPDRPHPNGSQRCLPSERRAKPSPEWNHYRVECRAGVIKLSVNGKEVSGGHDCNPRKGYICLEAEGSECHFRNLKIKELPSSGAKTDFPAEHRKPFERLYTGVDLSGWQPSTVGKPLWESRDWILACPGTPESNGTEFTSERRLGDFLFLCDWRWTGIPPGSAAASIRIAGPNDVRLLAAGGSGLLVTRDGEVKPRESADRPAGEWNRLFVTVRKGRATVQLNGKTVVDHSPLSEGKLPAPIALVDPGCPMEFANLLIQALE